MSAPTQRTHDQQASQDIEGAQQVHRRRKAAVPVRQIACKQALCHVGSSNAAAPAKSCQPNVRTDQKQPVLTDQVRTYKPPCRPAGVEAGDAG